MSFIVVYLIIYYNITLLLHDELATVLDVHAASEVLFRVANEAAIDRIYIAVLIEDVLLNCDDACCVIFEAQSLNRSAIRQFEVHALWTEQIGLLAVHLESSTPPNDAVELQLTEGIGKRRTP